MAPSGSSASVPSLPPPCPKSPPQYPDLYGKRRETARVQMLEREIGFLEEELKSVERLQPSSRCCKDCKPRSINTYEPKETPVMSLLEMALKCHAAVTAVSATVIRVPAAVRFQSGNVAAHVPGPAVHVPGPAAHVPGPAAHVPGPAAAKIFPAAKIVAFFRRVHVLIALVAIVSNGNALVLNFRSYGLAAVVEYPVVVTPAVYIVRALKKIVSYELPLELPSSRQ
ncbi:Guanine nucleotide-binding protein subunit gamma 3 [Prunus dulcis]|uniref:Guanine nucleotide-binding protein subunit gamma 3 n=1 Tax=Prunus dulcis TaxID=3755 RepID=A0A4Y1RWG2_PRUDU|nr:Guanine nucleotide-binding protein subunit gamma 3 [Prunus dulcis]